MIIQLDPNDDRYKRVAELVSEIFGVPNCYDWMYGNGGDSAQKMIVDVDEVNGDIRGFCVWSFTFYSTHIMQFATVEKYRKQGVGTSMLNWMKNIFFDTPLTLHVSVKNNDAIRLYKKAGFYSIYTLYNYYEDKNEGIYTGEGRNAYLMICDSITDIEDRL